MSSHNLSNPNSKLNSIVLSILNGISQIMLQENWLTGLLFLIGIFYSSPIMAVAVILSTVSGNFTAFLLGCKPSEILKGYYGFNPALLGAGMLVFFKPLLWIWIVIVLFSVGATFIQVYLLRKNINAFTLPFVLLLWLALSTLPLFDSQILLPPTAEATLETGVWFFPLRGIGQVIFQSSIIASLVIFSGLLIAQFKVGLWALFVGFITGILAWILHYPETDIQVGLYSFNAVLCVLALANTNPNSWYKSMFTAIGSLAFTIILNYCGIPQLTFPFVAATMISLKLNKKRKIS